MGRFQLPKLSNIDIKLTSLWEEKNKFEKYNILLEF